MSQKDEKARSKNKAEEGPVPRDNTRKNCSKKVCMELMRESQSDDDLESYDLHLLANKVRKLKKHMKNLEKVQEKSLSSGEKSKKGACSQTSEAIVNDLAGAKNTLNDCIREMEKVERFLNDENCWWKILKQREFACCSHKSPHLHGFLDGAPVTLKLLEGSSDDASKMHQDVAGALKSVLDDYNASSRKHRTSKTMNADVESRFIDSYTMPEELSEAQASSAEEIPPDNPLVISVEKCSTMEISNDQEKCTAEQQCSIRCVDKREEENSVELTIVEEDQSSKTEELADEKVESEEKDSARISSKDKKERKKKEKDSSRIKEQKEREDKVDTGRGQRESFYEEDVNSEKRASTLETFTRENAGRRSSMLADLQNNITSKR